jgi:hypothetical protein
MTNPPADPSTAPGQPDSLSIDFTTWVLSQRETVLVLLGLAQAEDLPAGPPDRDAARLHIDVLALILDRTRGNLSPEEDRLLRTVLYETRMAWLERQDAPTAR